MENREIISQYNEHRKIGARSKICHAPFSSINFEQNGNMTACCFNRVNILGKYPENTIEEAWKGENANLLRKKIDNLDLSGGCKLCGILIKSGNYKGSKAIYYDEYAQDYRFDKLNNLFGINPKHLPKVFEFEISNTCNLSCTMCNGYYSSTIRKKREKLPDIHQPYDNEFVNQVAHFLPHLTDLKFLGGEPFLIDIYYEIWNKIIEVNPKAKVHITTNGTILNNKVKDILPKLRAGIILSIDSVNKSTYEEIRVGSNFDVVMDNFHYFNKVTQTLNTYLSVSACAMSSNWKDIPELVRFANENQVSIHFNVVWNPGHLSMRYLNFFELEEIENYFNKQIFPEKSNLQKSNKRAFEELSKTVSMWKLERNYTKLSNIDNFENLEILNPEFINYIVELEKNSFNMGAILLKHCLMKNKNLSPKILNQFSHIEFNDDIKNHLFSYWKKEGDTTFSEKYFSTLPYLAAFFYGNDAMESFKSKCIEIQQYIRGLKEQQAVISDLIDDINKKSIVNHLQLIKSNSAESVIAHIKENY
jgi:MoaA/NifB/PqqE/SkfB family radical SAM enzyme